MRMMSNFLLLLVAVLPFGNPYSFVRISPTSTLFRRNLNLLQESTSSEITGLDDSSNRRVGKMGKASAELLLSVSNKGNEIFDFSETSNILTNDLFTQWERQVDDVIAEMIQFTRKDAVMAAYKSILTKASAKALDSLQQATFEVLSNSLVDALIKIHPEDAPITIVIDSLTNFHLTFIDDFAKTINERPTRY